MEYGIGKKQLLTTSTFGSEEAAAVFTTLTRWQMLAHVLFDLFALYLLNSLHPTWGVRKPRARSRLSSSSRPSTRSSPGIR